MKAKNWTNSKEYIWRKMANYKGQRISHITKELQRSAIYGKIHKNTLRISTEDSPGDILRGKMMDATDTSNKEASEGAQGVQMGSKADTSQQNTSSQFAH